MVLMMEKETLGKQGEEEMVKLNTVNVNVECPFCEGAYLYGEWVKNIQEDKHGGDYICPGCSGVCTPNEIDGQVEKITQ